MSPTPSCRGAPHPTRFVLSLWPPLAPLLERQFNPRCLLVDFAIPWVQTRGPDGTPMSNKTKKMSWRQQQSWSPNGSRARGGPKPGSGKVVSSAPPFSGAHPEGFKAPPTSQPGVGFGDPPSHQGASAGCASRKNSAASGTGVDF